MTGEHREVTDEHLARYLDLSTQALAKARVCVPEGTHAHRLATDGLDMVRRYLDDARHFSDGGDKVRAFAAVNYAHGWLDALARFGVLDVDHDSELFTVD